MSSNRWQQTTVNPVLSPARVMATTNVAGTYYNGNSSGVGSYIDIAATTLTIDGVAVTENDSVVLQAQTAPAQNGVYIVSGGVNSNGTLTTSNIRLTRRADFQTIGQMVGGQYVSVAEGTANKGKFAVLVNPLPTIIGTSTITFIVN